MARSLARSPAGARGVARGSNERIDPVESIGDIQAIAIEGDTVTGVFDRRRTGGVSYE